MLCKFAKKDKSVLALLIAIGAVSCTFGIIWSFILDDEQHGLMMTAGMFTGLGAVFIAIAVVSIIKTKAMSEEKLKEEEIERKDERNIQLMRASYTVAAAVAFIIFASMAFLFMALDYKVPGFIMVGCIYVQAASVFIAHKIFEKKM